MISLKKKMLLLSAVTCFVFGIAGCGKMFTEKADRETETAATTESIEESTHEVEK